MARDLTIKQRKFIREYVESEGNGTAAALAAYDTDSENTAGSIAVENLQKPKIRAALEAAFARRGLGVERVAEVVHEAFGASKTQAVAFKDHAESVDLGPDHGIRLRAVETWGKLVGAMDRSEATVKHSHAHLHLLGELRGLDPARLRRLARGESTSASATTGSGATPQDPRIIECETTQDESKHKE